MPLKSIRPKDNDFFFTKYEVEKELTDQLNTFEIRNIKRTRDHILKCY